VAMGDSLFHVGEIVSRPTSVEVIRL